MKQATALLIIALLLSSTAEAQKRKKPAHQTRPRTVAKEPPKPKPRIIGATVIVTTKNGDLIKGELLDLSAYSVRIRADKLESTLALESLSAISFDSTAVPTAMNGQDAESKPSANPEEFARDARTVLSTLDGMTTGNMDYTEYGRALSELRSKVEFFVQKYSSTENTTEARIVAMVGGAMTDYAWSRSIWTLKLGRSSNNTIEESDSPILGDALAVYPELKAANIGGTKYSADKLINGLWKRATEKTNRARALLK